jgi:hypothetical protein
MPFRTRAANFHHLRDTTDIDGITLFKPEGYPPVARDGHGEMTLQRSFERMQPEAWKIHVLRPAAAVEQSEDVAQLLQVLRCNSSRRPAIVERLEPSMPERSDHSQRLRRDLSSVN